MQAMKQRNPRMADTVEFSVHDGSGVDLYSSGAVPLMESGVETGLFSSGAAPASRAGLDDGTGTHLFSSGA